MKRPPRAAPRTETPDRSESASPPALRLRSGGWIFLVSLLLVLSVFAWGISALLKAGGSRAVGDGRNPETYGFDLTTLTVPRDLVVATGLPRDGLPALLLPEARPPEALSSSRRRKLLVPDDRVIGVVRNGAARAYPLRVLNWHEVADDTLGGEAIAVSYSPLGDAAVVARRRLNGETVAFGVSGLLYDSNHLLYDRRAGAGGESLWSPLGARAVAGPAAGARLALLPCQLVRWGDWLARHPETTVVTGEPDRLDRYLRDPYGSYFGGPGLRFPVRPLPPAPEAGPAVDDHQRADLKDPLLAVLAGGTWHVFPHPEVARLAQAAGEAGTGEPFTVERDGLRWRFRHRTAPSTVEVELESGAMDAVVHAFRYAWYALGPEGS